MGRKVNPIGFRLAVNRDWKSQWFANKKDFANCLVEDYMIRKYINDNHAQALISHIAISRLDSVTGPTIKIHVARPGVLIGAKGEDIGKLRDKIREITGKLDTIVEVSEVRNPDTDATLIARSIANRLEKRQRSRRVIQSTLQAVSQHPAVLGIKIRVKGRLEGADIARMDYRHEGRVPLHTLRANIDYGFAEAATQMGQLGVKVWVYRENVDLDKGIIPTTESSTLPSGESGLEALTSKKATKSHTVDSITHPTDQEILDDISDEFEDMED